MSFQTLFLSFLYSHRWNRPHHPEKPKCGRLTLAAASRPPSRSLSRTLFNSTGGENTMEKLMGRDKKLGHLPITVTGKTDSMWEKINLSKNKIKPDSQK